MKRNRIVPVILSAVALVTILGLPGCSKEEPPVVFDLNNSGGAATAITGVSPASALGLITPVTLTGRNFAPVDTQNIVYFGTARGTVISGTTTSLVVMPPDLDRGAYTIQVVVPGVFKNASFGPYNVEHAGIEYGNFQNLDEVFSIAMDASEKLFAQLRASPGDTARVYTIAPVEPFSVRTLFGTLKTSTLIGWPKASDMRIGPGGTLYLQQTNNRNLYTLPPGGGVTQLYATLPQVANAIDFDSTGNIFAGGNGGGMMVLRPDLSMSVVGTYAGLTIKALRVFNGELYAAVSAPPASAGVWKSRILDATGTLDTRIQVLPWANAGSTFPASVVWSLAIAADGTIYVGSDNVDPILMVPVSGSPSALYPGVLSPPATQLIWGNGQYLYCNRDHASDATKRRVIRIAMGKNGAPDFGRR